MAFNLFRVLTLGELDWRSPNDKQAPKPARRPTLCLAEA
jgi:hypothetical protein